MTLEYAKAAARVEDVTRGSRQFSASEAVHDMTRAHMWRWRSSRTILVATALVAFAALSAPDPFVAGRPASGPARPWESRCPRHPPARPVDTTRPRARHCTFADAVGAPLGFALARVPLRGKPLLRVALAAPALFPPTSWRWLMDLGAEASLRVIGHDSASGRTACQCHCRLEPVSLSALDARDGGGPAPDRRRLEEAALLVACRGRASTNHIAVGCARRCSPRRS